MLEIELSEEEFEDFKTEAEEMLNACEQSLLAVSSGKKLSDHYSKIFRVLHSLKGSSGMFGLQELTEHLHHLETCFTSLKEKENIETELVDLYLKGIDISRNLIEDRNYKYEFDYNSIKNFQENVENHEMENEDKDDSIFNKPLIYVIDDDSSILNSMEIILENHPFNLKLFEDPRKALEQLTNDGPDLVITDFKMPDINGLDLIKRVNEKMKTLPIIMVSGYLSKEILSECILNGVFATLDKPIDENRLITFIYNALKKNKLNHLLDRSMDLVFYLFSDVDEFLKEKGKDTVRTHLRHEINNLFRIKKSLSNMTNLDELFIDSKKSKNKNVNK